ncbi:MAG TPA: cellulose synthase family protein [Candidatus Angelobacter sp.]|jgi:cellulose synthase/poly-beta-1,6-N-acetylglucosamine synthase-like glycosyltransferase|nr:cellulose synthase family protein [Candidatus Angelobacter sp.]
MSFCNIATCMAMCGVTSLAPGPFTQFWHRLNDARFTGLYHVNAFDLAIMLPYFLVLTILAMYGIHRYALVYHYFKNHKHVPGPPPEVTGWPRVTVQLPIYNERYVIERLVEAVAQFDYPRELLEIQVLDDSTDETQEVARACVERHQQLGLCISYLHRDNREGYKAGALQEGLKSATGELIVIFDADFIPPADFLRRTAPYFSEAKLAMVQTRWSYINRNYSVLTEIEAILLDGHFVIEHSARSRSGLFFNFNGTAGVWRRAAIEDAGGWQHDTLTEDTDLSYRAQLRGWQFLYLPDIDCPSELPVEMNAFKSQQARWAKGLMQTAKKILPRVMRADVPGAVKAEAFFHLTGNISYPLMVFLSIILLPAMVVRFYQGWFQVLTIDLPLFVASTCSISAFYLSAERALYPKTWKRTFLYLPFVMAVGIGLSVRNAMAVIEAIFGVKSEFVRTPKYRVEAGAQHGGGWARKKYHKSAGWMPFAEVFLGLYFAAAIVYAMQNENYATVPFLMLFVWGYLYTGVMSLAQTYFERLRFGVESGVPETRTASTGAPGF